MTEVYTCMWEYAVVNRHVDAFMRAYGPRGEWVQLLRRAPGYLATELHRDRTDPLRFVTIDSWESESAWRRFRAGSAAEYEALDRRCAELTTHEREIGCFSRVD